MDNEFNKLNENIKIINYYEIDSHLLHIPKKWVDIFKENNINKRIEKTLNIWKSIDFIKLEKVIEYLKYNLLNVELIIYNNQYYILYIIKDCDNTNLYYIGNLSNKFFEETSIKEYFVKFPKSLKDFYNNIHNGFYNYFYEDGLLEINDIVCFYNNKDYFIDDLKKYSYNLDINIESTFGIAYNGFGDYVAIDVSEYKDIGIVLYHDDIEFSYKGNLISILDDWLLNLFEG